MIQPPALQRGTCQSQLVDHALLGLQREGRGSRALFHAEPARKSLLLAGLEMCQAPPDHHEVHSHNAMRVHLHNVIRPRMSPALRDAEHYNSAGQDAAA